MNLRSLLLAAVATAALSITPAQAAFHLFRIDQIYSNADGSVQYVVIREATGTNGENFWAGNSLRTTNVAGISKNSPFPSNLPSSSTASRSVLIATPGFAALNLVTPDFTIPARFIPTDGGTLDYASGTDHISLPPLPTDGATAIDRNGTPVAGAPKNFANATGTMTAMAVTSVEFYNASLDHYFISALAPDIDALDSGRISGWTRTGRVFGVFPSQAGGAGVTPVCRIIIPPPHGDSHFFGRSLQECTETLAKFPFMSQETPDAFFITLPVAGVCPGGTIPVYRVFSNRVDANHRYMIDRTLRDQMAAMGWTIEGDGPDFVVMCAPPAPATVNAETTMDVGMAMAPAYGGYGPP
ncbi:MAG: hypothetical protein E6H48_17225 [Betaproteobacteria bacterium]|nr:MAG: hypothetical protein E6H48_17225 [Betaproteobacteria bacterium]